jgi:hypothetical protein
MAGNIDLTIRQHKAGVVFESGAGIRDATDPTKVLAVSIAGLTTATTRTLAVPDMDVNLGDVLTAPTLTAGAEAANVIAVTFAAPAASVEQFKATVYDTSGLPVAAAFTMAETGAGAEVFGSGTPTLVFTTSAAGVAEISVTDVAGGSGKSPLLVISPLLASADAVAYCAPVMIVLTFD